MAIDWDSASFIRSGSTTTPPRPLFWRYSEIIDAAATGSSLAPPSAMLRYMAGCSVGITSPAHPPNTKRPIMATAPRIMLIPRVEWVVAHQPWLKGERGRPGDKTDIRRFFESLFGRRLVCALSVRFLVSFEAGSAIR